MPRLEGGPHGLKADPSARADDQDYRHGVMLPVGRAWLTVMCDAGSCTARWAGGLKRVSRAVAVARRAPGRATRSGSATARQSSLAGPFSKPHPRHTATARVPSAHASSAHGWERNACGMRWRQSRARLSREKLLHLVESFLKSTHVILRKNERNNTLLGGTDDKLDPGPSTYREMRDVRRFHLRHGADDLPGVRLRLHRLRPEVD